MKMSETRERRRGCNEILFQPKLNKKIVFNNSRRRNYFVKFSIIFHHMRRRPSHCIIVSPFCCRLAGQKSTLKAFFTPHFHNKHDNASRKRKKYPKITTTTTISTAEEKLFLLRHGAAIFLPLFAIQQKKNFQFRIIHVCSRVCR